jgi:hypothetical protein
VSKSSALALRPAAAPRARRFGSATAFQTLGGGVSSFFTLDGCDARSGIATYSLRIVNTTNSTLLCRIWIAARNGKTMLAGPAHFEVAPASTAATQFPLVVRDYRSFERAIAEISGDGVHCLVEAPRPTIKKPVSAYAIASAACLLLGFLALIAASALRSALPRINAFAAPPETLAGTTIRAEYAAAGAGRLSYLVLAPDGHTLASGSLSDSAGSIPIAIPSADQSGAYTLQLAMTGPLGRVEETRVLNALPTVGAKPRRSASIENISVNPLVVKPGEVATVAYAATGDGGYVRLEGTDGTIWAQRPFSPSGQTRFLIPPVGSQGGLRVVLHVSKGRTTAQSVAGLVMASTPQIAAAGVPQIVGDDDPTAPAAATTDENGTFELLTKEVRSGGNIEVKILSPRNAMRISLMDMQSHEISGIDIGADADVVTLRAPVVSVATRYVIQANFTDGFGEESVVEPITVDP